MKKTNKIIHLLVISALAIIASCVGTVEDVNPDTTKASAINQAPLRFDGIYRAVPISNSKVEVFFFPASSEAKDVTYMIYYDGLATPITVGGLNLRPDYRGLLRYTVTGLQINTNYTFQVQAKDKITGQISANSEIRAANTFTNTTAIFDGIGNAKNLPGADGITSVLIEWPEAYRGNPLLPPSEPDVVEYEIILVDSNFHTPGDINNDAFGEPTRKVVPVPPDQVSYTVAGLQPATKYYVQVRAIHHGYSLYGTDDSYKREENTKYLEIETLSADLADITYDPADNNLVRADGAAGKSALVSSWGTVQGAFDHYKIAYIEGLPGSLVGFNPEFDCSATGPIFCKKVNYDLNQATISDLLPGKVYQAQIFICQNAECSSFISFDAKGAETSPQVAVFGGITIIDQPTDFNNVEQVTLNMVPPDLSTGVMDGIAVKVYRNDDLGITQDYYLNLPDLNANGSYDDDVVNMPPDTSAERNTGLIVPYFDYRSDTTVVVSGVQVPSPYLYQFALVPYTIDNTGMVEVHEDNIVVKAIKPDIVTPTSLEFPGVRLVSCDLATQSIVVEWDVPDGGLYSHFEVFIKAGVSGFDFGAAIAGTAGYSSSMVDANNTTFTFPFMASGSYEIGVLTYYTGVTGKYSEYNLNIEPISVPGDCN